MDVEYGLCELVPVHAVLYKQIKDPWNNFNQVFKTTTNDRDFICQEIQIKYGQWKAFNYNCNFQTLWPVVWIWFVQDDSTHRPKTQLVLIYVDFRQERSTMWSWPKFWFSQLWIPNAVTYQFCSDESACQSPPTPERYGSREWSTNRGYLITGPLPSYFLSQLLNT